MGALPTFPSVRKTLILISTITAILVCLVLQETASATVPITNRHFKLVNGHDNARGVWGQGSTLWVVENDQSRNEGVIIAYNSITGKRRWVGDFGLSDHNLKIQGIWSDGATMWVADWDDKKIYAYELDRREVSNTIRIPDKDISLAGSNDAPRGVWGAGAMIFVVDKDDTKVYAYSTTDGSRLTDEEFDLDADNDNPWGIWGEGGRVWISDIDDDMLYVYERNPNSSTHGERCQWR